MTILQLPRLGCFLLLKQQVASTKMKKISSATILTLRCMASASEAIAMNKPLPFSELPQVPTVPIFGSIPYLATHPKNDVKANHKIFLDLVPKFGPIFKITIPHTFGELVICTNPDDIENVLRSNMSAPKRNGFESVKKIRDENINNYFEGKGGLLAEGVKTDEWWRIRSRVQTPMMRPDNISPYLPSMDEVALNFMDRIPKLRNEKEEMPDDFQFELYKWSLESVALVALNRRLGCFENKKESIRMIKATQDMFECIHKTEMGLRMWTIFPFMPSMIKLKKAQQVFIEIADKHILETYEGLKLSRSKHDDELSLMEILLRTPGLSRKDVVTMILDMLFAGIDTTSHTVAFTLYLLARNPEKQIKMQEEIDQVLGDGSKTLTNAQLKKLSYMKLVIKESLRVFPLIFSGTNRILCEDLVLSGYHIPKGTMVGCMTGYTGWNDTYFPQAKEFIPERWERSRPLGPIHPFSYMPFSYGTRMCIGRRIAEQEMYTFLARALHRYTVGYDGEDMDIETRLVSTPSVPLRFTFTERR
ncbi:unnamed protein product [Meganyctiphanes norvegica]|uniref:Cytochrome P450 n=1 Tax=Meganyctiphanes norvegica TaxID=48144 RepID=A0AAV2QR76_MEGNR